jgi:hypothetical protein
MVGRNRLQRNNLSRNTRGSKYVFILYCRSLVAGLGGRCGPVVSHYF